uniref:CIPKI n=1 Tax=Arundo donax TaxID=35708 RepID=A0A0A8YFZ1_ARUDO
MIFNLLILTFTLPCPNNVFEGWFHVLLPQVFVFQCIPIVLLDFYQMKGRSNFEDLCIDSQDTFPSFICTFHFQYTTFFLLYSQL